jgi:Arc/MetJ-type ribon-helix-helix transcriptional regulator
MMVMSMKEKLDCCDDDLWDTIREKLKSKGIDLKNLCSEGIDCSHAKIVCIAPDLGESVQQMGQQPRGETVMVRIDEETNRDLNAWVETGYFKSRSEAAALFIREGLKVRAVELGQMKEMLQQVEVAKKQLHEKARRIFSREE